MFSSLFFNVLIFVFSLLLCLPFAANAVTETVTAPATPTTGRTVIVDPGHGGHDKGASKDGVHESTIALAISKLLAEKLRDNGYNVILTRTKDESVPLEKRAAMANASAADLLVSIHINSSTDTRAQGREFYFQNQIAVDEEALFLANRENLAHDDPSALSTNPGHDRVVKAGLRNAEALKVPPLSIANAGVRADVKNIIEDLDRSARVRRSSELAKILHRQWRAPSDAHESPALTSNSSRGIRQAPFFLVSNVAIPSVLIEVGFLSHAKEGARLQQPEFQASLADSLANGIDQYFKRP